MVIVDRVVLDAAVVPKGNRIDTPAKATGEFGPHQVVIEIVEQRSAAAKQDPVAYRRALLNN